MNHAHDFWDTVQHLLDHKATTQLTAFVDKQISQGSFSINDQDPSGQTLVLKICGEGSLDMLGWILAKNPDVDQPDQSGDTPLHHAMGRKYPVDILKLLLTHKPNVNALNPEGVSPLVVGCLSTMMDHKVFHEANAALVVLCDHGADLLQGSPSAASLITQVPTQAANSPFSPQIQAYARAALDHSVLNKITKRRQSQKDPASTSDRKF